ncbi:nitrate reductase molybdenum cofactor assembly chaperone [Gordonia jinghuaiqii]|uniref:Nitrate reductase molybdenum cofactor assembly chaperone n=1 Tax=Gordonia jinghuaiqii TaxID=2758710 RepID=A0A7D7QG34_9ACTN|nr:nitrate reductase molybdenum cofactor assembly chaperone [Gordonia jinghuaiqii]MCR5979523.1 nitrate reductase molybdenum cofactor assembly chaperone [Gordonia jinghuaiqii]QMT00682.1 nitrate reductase molybdenum cofactor assembly chaperone [Gordonia jinghuaiqii]
MRTLRALDRRARHTTDPRVIHQIGSWCLSYPDDEVLSRVGLMRAALDEQPDGPAAQQLRLTVDHLADVDATTLRRDYIELFDLSKRHTLYLSYWTDGDTRRRGTSLGEFKQLYRDSGFLVDLRGELPDHLPIVLEFSARADLRRGIELLETHRAALELIKFALLEASSPYAGAVGAVCATLPSPSPADRESAMARCRSVPTETVGLEPFDPRLLPINPT